MHGDEYYCLIEKGTNLKVTQDVLGHTDIRTTMNIYVMVVMS